MFGNERAVTGWARAQEEGVGVGSVEEVTLDADLGASREGSRTGQYPFTHLFIILFIGKHTVILL